MFVVGVSARVPSQEFSELVEDARGMMAKNKFVNLAWEGWIDYCRGQPVGQGATIPGGSGPPVTREDVITAQFPNWSRSQIMAAVLCDDILGPQFANGSLSPTILTSAAAWGTGKQALTNTSIHLVTSAMAGRKPSRVRPGCFGKCVCVMSDRD